MVCSTSEIGPEFLYETPSCEYVFAWHTRAACPRHSVSTSTCAVTDPLYGHTFDFGPLRNNYEDYSFDTPSGSLYVNLCGPLVNDGYFELKNNSAVALSLKNKANHLSGGQYPANLTFNDGILSMHFTEGSYCRANETYSTMIQFQCDNEDHDYTSEVGALMYHHLCINAIVWRTKYACPPHYTNDCSFISEDGLKYDLNPLSSSQYNVEVASRQQSQVFVLNVCRSVVHERSTRCPYDAASCLVDKSRKNEAVSLGRAGKGPLDQFGLLKLIYEGGSRCNANTNYSSEIIFHCDESEYNNHNPILVAEQKCKYYFEWWTPHACPKKVENSPILGNCSVRNGYSNFLYDLSPLSKPEGYSIKKDDVALQLNVCDNMQSCPNSTDGACSTDLNGALASAGKANALLVHTPGQLTLRYSGGSKCANGISRTTMISFYCGAEKAIEGPVLVSIDDTSCIYFVNWHTELACDFRIDCAARSFDRTVDIYPLIKHKDNYEVSLPNSTARFHINVCRPLSQFSGIHCDAGSSACLIDSNSSTAISLGKPLLRPNLYSENSVALHYAVGSACKEYSGFNYSSQIVFQCDRSAGLVSTISVFNYLYCSIKHFSPQILNLISCYQ